MRAFDSSPKETKDWPLTFEDHKRRFLELGYSASPAQRLAWFEEALEFAQIGQTNR